MLTADEAASRLGIKVQSLYAYVSRGLIERHHDANGRSHFSSHSVDTLARRGRPRLSSKTTSLHLLVETGLTRIDSHRMWYRGHPVAELAERHLFEDVAELLWTGTLPHHAAVWPDAPTSSRAVRASRAVPASQPPAPHDGAGALDRVHLAVASARFDDAARNDRSVAAVAAAGRRLVGAAVAGCSTPGSGGRRTPRLTLADGPARRGTVAGRLWAALTGRRARPGMVEALNALLVLAADHELAASTLAARIAASVRADPYDVVAAALGVFGGTLHGRASTAARVVLDQATEVGAVRAVSGALDRWSMLPGFGQPLYPEGDPRAVQALRLLRRAAAGSRELSVVESVIDTFSARSEVRPNVDFALAAFTFTTQMPPDAGEAIFAVARIAGWLAHAIEEYDEAPLRFRPRAVYTGTS